MYGAKNIEYFSEVHGSFYEPFILNDWIDAVFGEERNGFIKTTSGKCKRL